MYTLDDLTGDEYATLAHRIKADPLQAILVPTSQHRAQAHAGLVWLIDLRTDPTARFSDYMALSVREINTRLGIYADPLDDDDLVDEDDDEQPTVVEAAQDAADEISGEVGALDPSAPPASPSSP